MGFISGLFKDKNQKYLENLKKNNKIREEEEQEKAEIFTIGKVDKEIHEKKDIEGALAQGSEEMKAIRASREKELKAIQDQLFVINGAKVKFGPHIGTFKVLSDTPTIQSKTVGTQIENTPLNFTFEDGFQLLTLTQWQDVGDAKFQDNVALIKKSTIVSIGKMSPANAPIESGKIEFIDSGQINVPENIDTTGMPLPFFDEQQMKYPPIVHFRPLPEWDGEFGFDWLRDDPTIVKVKRKKKDGKEEIKEEVEPPYCETIESFFDKSKFSEEVAAGNSDKNEAYNKLKKEYVKLTLSTGEEYYVPWLTLLPGKKAVLQLVYQGDTDTDMDILLEYKDNYIGITPYKKKNAIKSLKDAAGKKIKTIEITAIGTFNSIQEIKVYTSLMGEKVLIGELLVLPNDKIRTISKVKLIGVKTKGKVDFRKEQKDALERILSQAFLRVDYKDLSCTLKEEDIFLSNYMTSSGIVIAGEEFLKNLKEKYLESTKDDGSILVFLVDKEATDVRTQKEEVTGFTLFEREGHPKYPKDKVAASYEHSRTSVVFVENSEYTLAHEFLHCLGLGHIHRDFGGNGLLYKKQRFIFGRGANVTNIMGYSSIKKGILWSWQWRLLSPYLNEVITNKLEEKNEN